MRFSFYHVKNIAIRLLCIGFLMPWSLAGHAIAGTSSLDKTAQNLPDLPEADEAAPGHFSLDEQSAELGYDSRFRKWGAKLDEYSYLNPSLTLDYGMLLTSRFGAGATLTRHSGYSEVLLNGVYAPKRNLRMRVASGQLRTSADYASTWGGQSNAILQNSYLVDVRRNAGNERLLSDFGFTAYTVRANHADRSAEYAEYENESDLSALADGGVLVGAGDIDPSPLAAGRLDGYTLNLGLQPTPHSRFELKRERTHLSYVFGDGNRGDEYRDVNHIKYSQYFSNCARLQSRYSSTEDYNRLDLSLAKNRWSVNLSRDLDSDSHDTVIQVGYAIPLGVSRSGSSNCRSSLATGRAFEPLVNATVSRPNQLPRSPLAESISE